MSVLAEQEGAANSVKLTCGMTDVGAKLSIVQSVVPVAQLVPPEVDKANLYFCGSSQISELAGTRPTESKIMGLGFATDPLESVYVANCVEVPA